DSHPDACRATRYRGAATVLGGGVIEHGRRAGNRGDTGGPAGAGRAAGATDRGPTAEFLAERARGRMATGRRIDADVRRPAVVRPHYRSGRVVNTVAVLLAVALWIGPGPSLVRARAGIPARGHRQRRGLMRGLAHGPDPL